MRNYEDTNPVTYNIRMNNNRMPKIMLNYRPSGQRPLGKSLKRLLDEAKTGLPRHNS